MRTFFLGVWLFITVSCDKNDEPELTLPGAIPNTVPTAMADEDIFVFSPDNSVILQGTAEDKEHEKISFEWKMVKSLSAATIENPNIFKTRVSNLDTGEYEFELTAKDARGLSGKDTIKVLVAVKPVNEFISNSLKAECPMGCYVKVKIDIPLPPTYKVYVQYAQKPTNWYETIDVKNNSSTANNLFGISGDLLWIYSNFDDMQAVKIVY